MTPVTYPQSSRWETSDERELTIRADVTEGRAARKRARIDATVGRIRTLELQPAVLAIMSSHGVTLWQMASGDRTSRVVKARHRLWHAMRSLGMSYPQIGAIVERDHKSVMYGVKRIESEILSHQKGACCLSIRLDIRTTNPLNGSQGWTRRAQLARAAERKRLRSMAEQQTAMQLIAQGRVVDIDEPGGILVTLTRIAPRPLDDDGWQAAAKPIRDGVADHFRCADNDKRIKFDYAQRRGRVKEYAVEISIEARRTG